MPVFVYNASLSSNNLQLYISNANRQLQDAALVTWVVYNSTNQQVSGVVPAIKRSVGTYYAPWKALVPTGNYEIHWSITPQFGVTPEVVIGKFYIARPGEHQSKFEFKPGGLVYEIRTTLGRGDLPLFLKTQQGYSSAAFSVSWTIFNASGRALTSKTQATPSEVFGEYYASWYVNVSSGNYKIVWEIQDFSDSPIYQMSQDFSVIDPSIFGSTCGSCSLFIDKTYGNLPSSQVCKCKCNC